MKKLLLLLVAFGFSFADNAISEFKGSIVAEIRGFSDPEGIVVGDKYIYVSNMIQDMPEFDDAFSSLVPAFPLLRESGSIPGYEIGSYGYISKLDLDGNIIQKKFITGIITPRRMAIIGNTLYVVNDYNIISGFDLDTKEKVFYFYFDFFCCTNVLHDIVVKDKDTLIVSEVVFGKIYEVNIKTKKYKAIKHYAMKEGFSGSLLSYKNDLYISDYIGGQVIKFMKARIDAIVSGSNFYFGMAARDDKLFLSRFDYPPGGNTKEDIYLLVVDLRNNKQSKLYLPYIDGLSDIVFDKEGYLWIANANENRVLKVKIEPND